MGQGKAEAYFLCFTGNIQAAANDDEARPVVFRILNIFAQDGQAGVCRSL